MAVMPTAGLALADAAIWDQPVLVWVEIGGHQNLQCRGLWPQVDGLRAGAGSSVHRAACREGVGPCGGACMSEVEASPGGFQRHG